MPKTTANQSAINPPRESANWCGWTLGVLFFALCATHIANGAGHFYPEPSWLAGAFVVVGFAASIAALSPPLPLVSVIMAAGIAGGIGGILVAFSAATGYPLGPMEFTLAAGPRIANLLPWWMPMVWASIALSSRGTARFLLQGQRQHPQHGYQVILASTGLAVFANILFAHFGTHSDRYWRHDLAGSLFHSSGHVFHLVIQVAITALLLDKYPGERPSNPRPALVWVCIAAIFALGWLTG